MARSIEQRLTALRALDVGTPAAAVALREALGSANGHLVAAAARLVGEHHVRELFDDLAAAFERLCEDGAKRDPGCRGKIAIARALHAVEHWDERVLARGLRVVQPEGWAGGGVRDDAAAELRGVCGLAHAHLLRPDALDVLAELLADPERVTRVAAAQGIGDLGRPDGGALLRFKLLTGDREAEVVSASLESLLSLEREDACEFVVRLLPARDERADLAAIALASSRLTGARAPLLAWCAESLPGHRRRVGYLALALLRDDAATEHLLEVIRTQSKPDALAAARALATFRDDPTIAARLREAANAIKDPATRRELAALLA